MTTPRLLRLFAIVLGVGCLAVGLLDMRHGLTAMAWPSAPAKVIISERVGAGNHSAGNIVAEFRLGDGIYHCGTVIPGQDNSASDVRAYPVGRQIRVHYKPGNIGQCVFIPDISGGGIAFVLAGIGAFGLALYAHWSLRRRRAAA